MAVRHFHVVACQVFSRELSHCISQCPHSVSVSWLPQGLHDTPSQLRQELQRMIDAIERQEGPFATKYRPEAILLCYGLCSNGVVGIRAGEIPLVIPRTDDCIALFLGSQQRYLSLFAQYPGIYWLNNGWIESAFIPTREMLGKRREWYALQYGEDNADYLLEQEMSWSAQYNHCGFIQSSVYDTPEYRALAKQLAEDCRWSFEEFEGDLRLLRCLLNGEWGKEFLVCPPHCLVQPAYDGTKITWVPDSGESQKAAE